MNDAPADGLLGRLAKLSSASLHEAAGKIGALPAALQPIDPKHRICGRALPVRSPPGDNLFLHHAIYKAASGEVLVVDAGDGDEFGHWGDVMTLAAQLRGIAGLVITGGVRDSREIAAMGFPVFSRSLAIKGTRKDPNGDGSIAKPIVIGNVVVNRGDVIVGDADGVVVLPAVRAEEVADKAERREREEDEIAARLRAGETTLEISGLPGLETPQRGSGPRRSIEVKGLAHGNLPIPAASRVGNVVATGGVRGVMPETGKMPEEAAAQVQLMFRNLRTIIEASGAQVEDIVKVTVFVADNAIRPAINGPWLEMFPDKNSRPARHIVNYALQGGMLAQCEALAVVGGACR